MLQIDGPNQFIEVEVGFQNRVQIVTQLRAKHRKPFQRASKLVNH